MPEVNYLVIIGLFVCGWVAVMLEIFIPGGIVGTLGGLTMVVAIAMGFSKSPTLGGVLLVLGIVLVPVGLVAAMNLAPKLPFSRKLFLQEELDAEKGYISSEEGLEELAGKEGVAVTMLRPSGIAEIEGRRTDVVTDGEMIEKGVRIEVIQIEGNRVVVRAKNV